MEEPVVDPPKEPEEEISDEYLPPNWRVVNEYVSGAGKFYRNLKTGQKSLVHPYLRRAQSLIRGTPNMPTIERETIQAEHEFELGLVPDVTQARLLRMSIPTVNEMLSFGQIDDEPSTSNHNKSYPENVESQLSHLMNELVTTERKYVEDLDILIKKYLVRMTNSRKISKKDLRVIFINIEFIKDFHVNLLQALEKVISIEGSLHMKVISVGNLFDGVKNHFNLYLRYGSSQAYSCERLSQLRTYIEIENLLQECNLSSTQVFDLNDLLNRPIQRLLKYPLLFSNITKLLSDGPEFETWQKNFQFMSRLASDINERKRMTENQTLENSKFVSSIQKLDPNIVPDLGKLLLHAEMYVKKEKEEDEENELAQIVQSGFFKRHVLLFETTIIICNTDGSKLTLNESHLLSNVLLHFEEEGDENDEEERDDKIARTWIMSVGENKDTITYRFRNSTIEDRDRWFETAFALNRRLRPLVFKKKSYKQLLALLFNDFGILAELLIKINKGMLRAQVNSVLDLIVFSLLHSLASEKHVEYFVLNFIKAVITAELGIITNLDEFLMGDSLSLKLISSYLQKKELADYSKNLVGPILAPFLEVEYSKDESSPDLSTERKSSNEFVPIMSRFSSQLSLTSISSTDFDDKKDAPKKRTPSFHDSDSKSLNTEKKKYGFLTLRKGLKKDRSSVDIGELSKSAETLEDIPLNPKKLQEFVDKFLSAILASVKDLPYGLKYISSCLKSSISKKYPNSNDYLRMIGQVIFYRFINPLILSPEKYFPNFENIGLQQKIHLIRISKILQKVSLDSKFESTESLAIFNPNFEGWNKKMTQFCEESTKVVSLKKQFGSTARAKLKIKPSVLYELQSLLVEYMCDVSQVPTATNKSNEKSKSSKLKKEKVEKAPEITLLINVLCSLGSPPENTFEEKTESFYVT